MDYNMFARHSRAKKDAAHEKEYEARALTAFRNAFNEQYNGSRTPLQLGSISSR
jgi:hypothetical protein